MKKMGMGMKISLGFGFLIVIAVFLGCLAVWNMRNVEAESTMLAQEYVPEVAVAVELRGAANRVMFEMRGYGLSSEKAFFDAAQKELKAVDAALEKGKTLERNSPNLTQLKVQLDIAEKAVGAYKALARETLDINTRLEADRAVLDESAAAYMSNSNAFLAGQNEKFKVDLQERQKKISLVSQLVDSGARARVMNLKSQVLNDTSLMKKAMAELGKTGDLVREMRLIARSEDDIRRMDAIEKSSSGYMAAMEQFLAEKARGIAADTAVLAEIRQAMDDNAAVYVKNCDDFLAGQQAKLTSDMLERLAKITLVNDIIDIGNDTRIKAFKSQALRDPDIMTQALGNFSKMAEAFEGLKAITHMPEDLKRIDEVSTAGNRYKEAMGKFLDNWLALQNLALVREETGNKVINACRTTADAGMDATDRIANSATASLGMASTVMITGLMIALAVGIAAAFFIIRSITGPITRVISGLTEASGQVASAAGQVSGASQSLAEGASEQAASIEETSSSMEEMSSMTRQNSTNASQADAYMKETILSVEKANRSMDDLTVSMADISKASEETSKIIKTIDEIAFQTNLLALNAAVEAARAGEAGAGFAVVAEEVRNLAMRSAEAAKTTAALIEGTVKKVNDGASLVDITNKTFNSVAESAAKVGELVSEISAASNEQATGIEQVNLAIVEMDKVIQQNAANAEESASASEEMNAQAETMTEFVGELAALVGGKSAKSWRTSGNKDLLSKRPSGKALQKSSGNRSARRLPGKNPSEVRPEQVIPFDDDFTDF